MNFNRQDSLNLMDVLKDPKFVKFLKKWEQERHLSDLSGTINPHTTYHFLLID